MTTARFRYLIITEDEEVLGTNSLSFAQQLQDDFCTVIDVEAGTLGNPVADGDPATWEEIGEAVPLEDPDEGGDEQGQNE